MVRETHVYSRNACHSNAKDFCLASPAIKLYRLEFEELMMSCDLSIEPLCESRIGRKDSLLLQRGFADPL